MTHIIYVLNHDPIPLARGRIGGRYAKKHVYDSQTNQKLITGISISSQHGDREPYQGALELNVTFFISIPAKNMKKLNAHQYHMSPPDLTNLCKYIEDTCQDVGLFKNDCQIARIVAEKKYDFTPRTEFWFGQL